MVQSAGLFTNEIVVRVQVPIRKRPSRDQPQRVLFNRTVNMSLTTSNPKAPTHHPLPSLIPLQSHSEALHHLRASLIAILSISVISALLPLPTPLQAFGVVSGWSAGDVEEGGGGGGWGWWLGLSYAGSSFFFDSFLVLWLIGCILELTVLSILLLNVAQSTYTLRYPRTFVPFPPPPTSTPGAKNKNNKALMTPVNNSSKVKRKLSPNVRSLPPSPSSLLPYTYPSWTNRHPPNPNNNSHSPHPTHPHHSQLPLARSTTPSLPPPHNHLLYPNLVRLRSRLRPLRRGGILWGVLRVGEREWGLGVRWRRIEGDMSIVLDVSFFFIFSSFNSGMYIPNSSSEAAYTLSSSPCFSRLHNQNHH
jgi:hypothetical protein